MFEAVLTLPDAGVQRFGMSGGRPKTSAWIVIGGAIVIAGLTGYAAVRRQSIPGGGAVPLVIAALYAAAGIWALRTAGRAARILVVSGRIGLALAGIEILNIAAEQFAGLRAPLNAIVPATTMAIMVLAFGVAATLAFAAARSVRLAIAAALWTAVTAMALTCAVGLLLNFGFLRNAIVSAVQHMVAAPLVAAVTAVVSVVFFALCSRSTLLIRLLLAAAALVGVVVAVSFLALASSLPRRERPPLVTTGMLIAWLTLAAVPPLAMSGRKR
jgi:hypothetical protein